MLRRPCVDALIHVSRCDTILACDRQTLHCNMQCTIHVRRAVINWLQARCHSLMWAPLVNRVLRDLRRREVAWSSLTDWVCTLDRTAANHSYSRRLQPCFISS